MSKIYYVYRHVRLDTDEVFYVGKGTILSSKNNEKSYFQRAFQKTGRTDWWHRVVQKGNYKVEILFQSSNEELIFQKEREFIELYGRQYLVVLK